MRSVVNDDGFIGGVVYIHYAEGIIFRRVDRRLPELYRRQGGLRCKQRIGRIFVANHGAIGNGVGIRFEAHLPINVVRREETQVDAAISRGSDVAAHLSRPIFIVAYREVGFAISEQIVIRVQVQGGGIGNVITFTLEKANHVVFPAGWDGFAAGSWNVHAMTGAHSACRRGQRIGRKSSVTDRIGTVE